MLCFQPAEVTEKPACPGTAVLGVGERGCFRSLRHSDPTRNVALGQDPSGQERMTLQKQCPGLGDEWSHYVGDGSQLALEELIASAFSPTLPSQ